MVKYHKIISVIISLVFLILLQKFSVPKPIFRFLVPGFLVFLSLVTFYNRWYLQQLEKFNLWILLRPVLFYTSAFAVLHIIPGDFLRGSFLVLAVIFSTIFEIFLGKFAENIILNETLIIAFGFFMAICASALLYAPGFQTWYVIAVFASVFFTTRSFYDFVPANASSKLVSSLVIAFFCAQVFLAITFLPLHYSASALMLFNIFYFCLILNYYYAFNTLNERKFQFHLGLMVVCSGLVFLLTPWKIIS